jgi:hypothetical protein
MDDECAEEQTRLERTVLPRTTIAAMHYGGCRREWPRLVEAVGGVEGGLERADTQWVRMMLQSLCMTTRWEYAPLLIQTLESCGAWWWWKKERRSDPSRGVSRPRALAKGASSAINKYCPRAACQSRLRHNNECSASCRSMPLLLLCERSTARAPSASVRFWLRAALSMECAQEGGNRRNTRVSGAVDLIWAGVMHIVAIM